MPPPIPTPSSPTGRGCHSGQDRAGGEQGRAGHGGCTCTLPGPPYPPAITTGCCPTPAPPGCDSRSRWHPACSPPAGARCCPQLLPAHLHPDTGLSLGAGNNGNRRGEDFWGRCVWSRGRHRLFVMPSSFSEGCSACLPSLWDPQCPSAPALTVLLPGPIYTALPGLSTAEALSTSTCSKTPFSWSVCAGALAGCQQKGNRREERGEQS